MFSNAIQFQVYIYTNYFNAELIGVTKWDTMNMLKDATSDKV